MNVTQTYKPEKLVVCRDGLIDDEYYDALYATKRRAALEAAGKNALNHIRHLPIMVGKGAIWLMNNSLEAAK